MKNKLSTIIMAICLLVVSAFVFAGCDLSFFDFGNVELKDGSYKVTTYSVNGISQSQFMGEYAVVDGDTLSDWMGGTAAIETEFSNVVITWTTGDQNAVYTGTFKNDKITLNFNLGSETYLIVLTYEENETLLNGSYEVTSCATNGVTQTEQIGKIATVSGSTFSDWMGGTATYVIKGKSIVITWAGSNPPQVIKGTIANNVITINQIVGSSTTIIVLIYKAN